MKKFSLILLLIFSSFSFAGGIPTIDVASILQLQLEAAEQAKRWTETVQQYKDQLKNQREMIASQTGIRDIAGLVKESESFFKDAKELQNWISNPKKILDMGFDSLNDDLKKIYNSYGLNHLCGSETVTANSFAEKERKNCEGQIILMTLEQQQANNNLKNIDDRVKTINKIATRMASSKDQKESQDLNNAMSTQLALLQAEKLKMDIQAQQATRQKELIEVQQENIMKEKMELNRPSNTGKWN